ncbi:hypothetical protein NEIRO03_1995 [Nematocida sp. AWRm78]|nr:hypothetical protein NEIRO02_2121 [Nematocida sp. AWRm79]KAI5185330.1 hypothetical protein NEIRO03_1995 [Nematocida sp. AWRm78]
MKKVHTFILLLCSGYLASFACTDAPKEKTPQINSDIQTKAATIYGEVEKLHKDYTTARTTTLSLSDELVNTADGLIKKTEEFGKQAKQSDKDKKDPELEQNLFKLHRVGKKLKDAKNKRKSYEEFIKTTSPTLIKIRNEQVSQWKTIKAPFDTDDSRYVGWTKYKPAQHKEQDEKDAQEYTKFVNEIKSVLLTNNLGLEEKGDILSYLTKFESYLTKSTEDHTKKSKEFSEFLFFSILKEKLKSIISHIQITSGTPISTAKFAHSTDFTKSNIVKTALKLDESEYKKVTEFSDVYNVFSKIKGYVNETDYDIIQALLEDEFKLDSLIELSKKKYDEFISKINEIVSKESDSDEIVTAKVKESITELKNYVSELLSAINRSITEDKIEGPIKENNTKLSKLKGSDGVELDMDIVGLKEDALCKWFGFKEVQSSMIMNVLYYSASSVKTAVLLPYSIVNGVYSKIFSSEWDSVMNTAVESSNKDKKEALAGFGRIIKNISQMNLYLSTVITNDSSKEDKDKLTSLAGDISNLITAIIYVQKIAHLKTDEKLKDKKVELYTPKIISTLQSMDKNKCELCTVLNKSATQKVDSITQLRFISDKSKSAIVLEYLDELIPAYIKSAEHVKFLFSDKEKETLKKSSEELKKIAIKELKPNVSLKLEIATIKSIRNSVDVLINESSDKISTVTEFLKVYKSIIGVNHGINLLKIYVDSESKEFHEPIDKYISNESIKQIEKITEESSKVTSSKQAFLMCEMIISSLGQRIPRILSSVVGKSFKELEADVLREESDVQPLVSSDSAPKKSQTSKYYLIILGLLVVAGIGAGGYTFMRHRKENGLLQ